MSVAISWSMDLRLTALQITCLYDMDIVFQSSGNFDEVYLYVRNLNARSHLNAIPDPPIGRTHGS